MPAIMARSLLFKTLYGSSISTFFVVGRNVKVQVVELLSKQRERERERAELKGTFLASAEHTAEQINDDDYTQAKL